MRDGKRVSSKPLYYTQTGDVQPLLNYRTTRAKGLNHHDGWILVTDARVKRARAVLEDRSLPPSIVEHNIQIGRRFFSAGIGKEMQAFARELIARSAMTGPFNSVNALFIEWEIL